MSYKRILTIQDISCLGQCSLTVALPILSACGMETVILPSAVLSTHTGGFTGYTFRDLTDDIPKIKAHWQKEKIKFDGIYTGYLGSTKQIEYVKDIIGNMLVPGAKVIVDPAMADGGKLYPGFDNDFVEAMKTLCFGADIIIPNITEACLLTGFEYKEKYDRAYIDGLLNELKKCGAGDIILTGIGYEDGYTGVVIYENGNYHYYKHEKIAGGYHGTGDVYASSFVGAMMNGRDEFESAKIAADYTLECIKATKDDENHKYGVKFELAIPKLIESLF